MPENSGRVGVLALFAAGCAAGHRGPWPYTPGRARVQPCAVRSPPPAHPPRTGSRGRHRARHSITTSVAAGGRVPSRSEPARRVEHALSGLVRRPAHRGADDPERRPRAASAGHQAREGASGAGRHDDHRPRPASWGAARDGVLVAEAATGAPPAAGTGTGGARSPASSSATAGSVASTDARVAVAGPPELGAPATRLQGSGAPGGTGRPRRRTAAARSPGRRTRRPRPRPGRSSSPCDPPVTRTSAPRSAPRRARNSSGGPCCRRRRNRSGRRA